MTDEATLLYNQTAGFLGLALAALVVFGLARWRWPAERFPHRAAWVLFVLHAALLATVPALRAWDQEVSWCYALRGVTIGFLLASMTRFRDPAPTRGEASARQFD